MSSDSPVIIPYDGYGRQISIRDASALSSTSGILSLGSDGISSRYIKVDSLGNQTFIGIGTAGTPSGGILTIQGVSGGQVVPVSGTITANIGTISTLATEVSLAKLTISPGTALGSNTQAMVGGSVTTAAPSYTTGNINPLSLTTAGALRIDGSGVTQPVSGTITANAGTGNFTVVQSTSSNLRAQTASESATGSAIPSLASFIGGSVTTAAPSYSNGNLGALSLTTGGLLRVDNSGVTQPVSGTIAATQSGTWTVQPGNTANTTPWLITLSQGGNSATVTGSNALKVDGSAVTQPVSGTITANIGTIGTLATEASLAKLTVAQGASLGSNTQALIGGSVTTSAPTYTTGQISPLSINTSGQLRVEAAVSAATSSNATLTNVASSATSITILSSNGSRTGATIQNDSTANLYLKFGTTASTTSYTVYMGAGSYYELPYGFTGRIDGIWDLANGFARCTEISI